MQDACYDEKIKGLIDDLRLQVPMLGGGVIGQTAFTKKHQWISSENHNRGHDASNSIWDMFVDGSELQCQFSSGIKTIAAIPVEPQGVVQFGSTQMILDAPEFVNQTKRMFQEVENGGGPEFVTSSSQVTLLDHYQSTTQLQANSHFGQFIGDFCNATATCSSNSSLVSFKDPLVSESRALESWNSFSTQSNCSLPFTNTSQDLSDSVLDFGIPDEIFETGDFNVSQWFPTPDQSNVTQNNDLLSQAIGLVPVSCDEKGESLTMSGIDVDLLGSTGDWGGVVMPVVNVNHLNHVGVDTTALGPRKKLFSKLGIEELLEGISGTSNAASTSCVEDQLSLAAKRRKTGSSMWEMSSLHPVVYNNHFEGKKEALPGLWMGDAYSMNCLSHVSQAKKQVEPPKPVKKKAKPGTRPRPKDRQQILDRMAELRGLIPNGDKISIDCLLDRTIKHMLFLQSVTEHAERIKLADEPKSNNGNDPNSNGVTWACELGNQMMICPLIVEDLSTPGQMLIEMLCEEQRFFLEIVDIIRGFGLTVLKGVMEVRNKIWARFIVEAEVKRHVTRHEVFSALVQLLRATCLDDNKVHNNVMEAGNSVVQFPVSLPETHYCVNL